MSGFLAQVIRLLRKRRARQRRLRAEETYWQSQHGLAVTLPASQTGAIAAPEQPPSQSIKGE